MRNVFRILAGAMLNSKYLTSTVPNVFDVEDEKETPHYFQNLPLPPVLTYQIQGIIGLIMLEDQKAVISYLKKKIFRGDKIGGWYEIFMAVFILTCTLEFVYQVQLR